MQSLRFAKITSRTFFILGVVVVLTCAAGAQDYANGRGFWPNPFAQYVGQNVPPPNFTNSSRINQLIKSGKLYLSMDDAIALALENNLDLAIARYNLDIANTDILRTKSGAAPNGVATGLVTGTPGGTGPTPAGSGGSSPGGTSAGAGGAGAGVSGLVQSSQGAGPPVPSFDPALTSTLQLEHSTTPQSNSVVAGVPFLQQNTGTVNFGYTQAFPTGTSISATFNNYRQTSNSIRTSLVPLLNSTGRFQISQHLLAGFGLAPNRRFMEIAKNNREISDIGFRQQVIYTVTQIQNLYWDLVNAYEIVRVNERSLALGEQLLSDTQKQVQIGTQAPIEVVSSEANVATNQQNLIVSRTNLQYQQLLMKNALTRNMQDAVLADVGIVPTDTMQLPAAEPVVPTEDLISEALSGRPELAQSRIDLTNRQINNKAARNALLPSVDLVGWWGGAALGGDTNPVSICTPANTFGCTPPGNVQTSGLGSVYSSLFGGDYQDYAVGFTLNIPLRNRSAQATQIRAELEYRQAQTRLQQLENQVRLQVRSNQFAVQQDRARVEAAQAAVRYANEALDAEQKKYALGASTNYNVQQMQTNLATAESTLLSAMNDYEKARVALDQVTGSTLTTLGIVIADAEKGTVQTMPHVPNVAPRPESETPGQAPPAAPTTPQQLTPPPQAQQIRPQP